MKRIPSVGRWSTFQRIAALAVLEYYERETGRGLTAAELERSMDGRARLATYPLITITPTQIEPFLKPLRERFLVEHDGRREYRRRYRLTPLGRAFLKSARDILSL